MSSLRTIAPTVLRAVAALQDENVPYCTALQVCDFIGCDETTPLYVQPLCTLRAVEEVMQRLFPKFGANGRMFVIDPERVARD